LDTRRRAGAPTRSRFTRTSLKPRILFPTEEQIQAKDAAAAEEADEEALTDIEVPYPNAKTTPQPSKSNKTPSTIRSDIDHSPFHGHPERHSDQTPIPSESAPVPADESIPTSNGTNNDHLPNFSTPAETELTNKRLHTSKKGRTASPFDKWSRTKHLQPPSTTDTKPAKRQGSPLEKQGKRVRSGSFTTNSAPT
jgi:hypothetical protein